MEDIFKEKLIGSNELCDFYTNFHTESLTKKAKELNRNFVCVIVKQKENGMKEYLIVNKKTNKPIYSNSKSHVISDFLYLSGLSKKYKESEK